MIASEYPSRPVQMAAYAFALAISTSRVTARQHFPSDVLIGSTFGYLIGGYVVRHHSDENLSAGFSFVPVVDMPTHTFGASVDIRPEQFGFTRIGRFVNRMILGVPKSLPRSVRQGWCIRYATIRSKRWAEGIGLPLAHSKIAPSVFRRRSRFSSASVALYPVRHR